MMISLTHTSMIIWRVPFLPPASPAQALWQAGLTIEIQIIKR
jgi:hypothetical protein